MQAVRQGSRRKGLATVWASSFLFALCVLCCLMFPYANCLCPFVWLSVYNKGKTYDTQAIFHRRELMVGSWARAKGIWPLHRLSIPALVYTDLDSISYGLCTLDMQELMVMWLVLVATCN